MDGPATSAESSTRRTQAERRADSRDRLLDATVDCLCDRGHAATTVTEVARRAGLSTGCLQSHFPTKQDLISAAVEHSYGRHRERLLQAFTELPQDEGAGDPMHGALDLLWQAMHGEAFKAYLELVVAARTDPALHAQVARTADRLGDQTRETFRALYTPPAGAAPFVDVMHVLVFGLLQGLMLDEMANPARGEAQQGLAALKQIHTLLTQASHPATASPEDPHVR